MRKYIAEFIGTCVLVVFGCGVAVLTEADVVATSLAFGLAIVAMAHVIGNVSGCHVNPAVSFAMVLTKKLSWKEFCFYVIAQVAGAFAGCGLLALMLPKAGNFGANDIGSLSIIAALLVEVVLTFVFVYTILGVTNDKDKANVSGLVIGSTLAFVHLLGIKLTGTSVNPARSLAPAVITGGSTLCHVWIFIVGPLLGALIAACVYKYLNEKKK